jgi:adenosylmethionine-8-amino-7-oxononanoate aminotransferase
MPSRTRRTLSLAQWALPRLLLTKRINLIAAGPSSKGKRLLEGVKQLLSLDIVSANVRAGLGMLVGLELVEDKATKKAFDPAKKMGERLPQRVLQGAVYTAGSAAIFIVLAPPFVTSDAHIDQIVNILGESVKALQ